MNVCEFLLNPVKTFLDIKAAGINTLTLEDDCEEWSEELCTFLSSLNNNGIVYNYQMIQNHNMFPIGDNNYGFHCFVMVMNTDEPVAIICPTFSQFDYISMYETICVNAEYLIKFEDSMKNPHRAIILDFNNPYCIQYFYTIDWNVKNDNRFSINKNVDMNSDNSYEIEQFDPDSLL